MSAPFPVENIVFSITVDITTSPVCTFTNLKIIVTTSCLYFVLACTPKILAPIPPDLVSESYPTIPVSYTHLTLPTILLV